MATKEQSYYEILEVDKLADHQIIKKAYHNLSRKYHPDKLPNEKKAFGEAKIKEINEAYAVLSYPDKRKLYDKYGKEGLQEVNSGFVPRFRIPTIKVPLKVTLEELYMGKSVTIEFERKNICAECDMTGAKDKKRHKCRKCSGLGKVRQAVQHGPFIQEQIVNCIACKGLRIDPSTEVCPECGGKAYQTEKCKITKEIPPGSDEQIILHNIGDELPAEIRHHGVERGVVVLILEETEHEIFKRCNEADLLIGIELSLEEALCGFKRVIRHLDGRKLAIIETDPIDFGTRKVVQGEGMKLQSGGYGNLIIQFSFKMPTSLSEEQKRTLYSCLANGGDFDTVDRSVASDEVNTNLVSEIPREEKFTTSDNAECCIQ